MTFTEITRVMLSNMDFFQLRNVAKKYDVSFRGVRRQQLLKDVEKVIVATSMHVESLAAMGPQGATSAKPVLTKSTAKIGKKRSSMGINTFSARNSSL